MKYFKMIVKQFTIVNVIELICLVGLVFKDDIRSIMVFSVIYLGSCIKGR